MTTSTRLLDTLKRELKTRGITYRGLAMELRLSESAVKHMFSTGNFSLKRMDEICDVLELDIGELVNLSESQHPRIEELSSEAEHEIVSDIRLLLIAYCLINFWTFEEILDVYDISRREGIRYLRKLDRMNIIELQPGDRVRLLIASNFAWRKNGAIEQFFNQHVQTEFFNHHFRDDGSLRIVKNGMLTRKSQRQLLDKLRAIGELFDDTIWEERKLPARDKLGTSMVLAVRHSFFRAFRELERSAVRTP
jgi:DNA-binding Xre family transcriptional regulator